MGLWTDIDFKNKSRGQVKVTCPSCISHRTNKQDTSLSINFELGVGKCHYCGDVFVKEGENRDRDEQKVVFEIPPQDWQNYTNLSDGMVKWFSNERKISQITLDDFKITEETVFFHGAGKDKKGANMNAIAFNYFEDGVLVHKHYRSSDKHFTQLPNGKKTMYNIDSIKDNDYVIITEGQIDCMSFHEVNAESVVSVPSGANSFNVLESMMSVFDGKKIYLGTDRDIPGVELEKKIIKLFGKSRCYRIDYPLDCKDPNDVLVKHGSAVLYNAYRSAKNVALLNDVIEEPTDMDYYLDKFYHGGLRMGLPMLLGTDFDNQLVFRENAYHIIVAKTNIGKSVIGYWMLYRLAMKHDSKILMYSMENSNAMIRHTLISYYLDDSAKHVFVHNRKLWREAADFVDSHFTFINNTKGYGLEEALGIAKAIKESAGADFLFLDPINSVPMVKPDHSMTDYSYHVWSASKMLNFSKSTLSIIMSAHAITGVGRSTLPPTTYDIEQGGVYANKADTIIIFDRKIDASEEKERNTTSIWVSKARDHKIFGGSITPKDRPLRLRYTGHGFNSVNKSLYGDVDENGQYLDNDG